MLQKQGSEMGQCWERTDPLIIPIPEIEAQKWWCSYCSNHVYFPILVLVLWIQIVQYSKEANRWCVSFWVHRSGYCKEWCQWGQSRCGSLVFLLPPKVIKEKEKQNLIIASALSRIYGRLSKFSEQKRFKKYSTKGVLWLREETHPTLCEHAGRVMKFK